MLKMFGKFRVLRTQKRLKSMNAYPTFKNENKKKDRGFSTYFTDAHYVLSMGTKSEYYPKGKINKNTIFKNVKGSCLYQKKVVIG